MEEKKGPRNTLRTRKEEKNLTTDYLAQPKNLAKKTRNGRIVLRMEEEEEPRGARLYLIT